jgi:tetratricopeptide (TPR) repeat protein
LIRRHDHQTGSGRGLERRLAALGIGLVLSLAAVALPAAAQDAGSQRAEFLSLYQQLLKNPTNVELTLRYARLGAELGDYEASVSALERLLIYNPNLPTAELELGLLYARLKSYAMARAYLEQASAAPNASPELRARAQDAIAKVEKLSSPHQFAGQVELGFQYQTDANQAPGAAVPAPPGFTLPSIPLSKRSDSDLFLNAAGIYRYDLGNAESDTLEATGTLYESAFLRDSHLDLGIAELTFGPRLTLDRIGIEHASLRPYLLGTYVTLNNNSLLAGGGAGVELAKAFSWRMLTRLYYEHEERGYFNQSIDPFATQLDGHVDVVRLTASQELGEASTLDLLLRYVHEKTRFSFDTNSQYRIEASYSVRYGGLLDPGFPGIARPWETSLEVGHDWTPYDGANPAIDPLVKRSDRSWFFGASQFLHVTKWLAAGIGIQRQITSSNLSNFSFNNTTATFSAKVRF